ncbi:MAG: helix-hairpin-helix domain-containing protein, partial [Chloroflexota bacterium]|nr:helix-hairpin-helix domain-containing protein [Chloroflexota bacterium]
MAPEDDDVPTLTNGQLARIFHDIGDMLEVKGELVFKTVAYHRAADAIAHSPIELVPAYRAGQVPKIAGVGQAISDKIAELASTGRLAFYDRLVAEVPPSLVELLRVPGVGPRTVKILHEQLAIDSLEDLRQAAESGSLRSVKGLSEKTEESILEGIAALGARETRLLLGAAEELIETLIGELRDTPGLISIEPAGSFRRRRETIGDLDLLAETSDSAALINRFTGLGSVESILMSGPYKAAVRLLRGPQVDLMVMPPGAAGTYRIHFTGSKEH